MGNADPRALTVAVSAAQAVERDRLMLEAQIIPARQAATLSGVAVQQYVTERK